jgi:hypothetical protein
MLNLLGENSLIQAGQVIGRYNLFKDPSIISMGEIPSLKKVFDGGDAVTFYDVPVPLSELKKTYDVKNSGIEALYHDIMVFNNGFQR